uniref:Uncharacterized protein n=1 Tax=Romanomermis culicivorax TaxID=13658 RepID=A0A915IY05_ROMCU
MVGFGAHAASISKTHLRPFHRNLHKVYRNGVSPGMAIRKTAMKAVAPRTLYSSRFRHHRTLDCIVSFCYGPKDCSYNARTTDFPHRATMHEENGKV